MRLWQSKASVMCKIELKSHSVRVSLKKKMPPFATHCKLHVLHAHAGFGYDLHGAYTYLKFEHIFIILGHIHLYSSSLGSFSSSSSADRSSGRPSAQKHTPFYMSTLPRNSSAERSQETQNRRITVQQRVPPAVGKLQIMGVQWAGTDLQRLQASSSSLRGGV